MSYWLASVFAWVKDLANMLIGGVLPVYEIDNTELWPVTPDLRVMMGVEGWVRIPLAVDYATVFDPDKTPGPPDTVTGLLGTSRLRRCLGVIDYHDRWALLLRKPEISCGNGLELLAPFDLLKSHKERHERYEQWCHSVSKAANEVRRRHMPPGHVQVLDDEYSMGVEMTAAGKQMKYTDDDNRGQVPPRDPPQIRNTRSVRVDGALMFDELDTRLYQVAASLIEVRSKGLGAVYGRCANVILVGPPGAGKTTRALKLAYQLGRVLDPRTVSNVWNVQALKKANPKHVLFLDEVDRMVATAGISPTGMPGLPQEWIASQQRAVVQGLLKFLDGLEGSNGRVVLMACNRIDDLDAALLSRCVVIRVEPPDAADCWRYMCEFYGDETNHASQQMGTQRLADLVGKVTLRELAMHCRRYETLADATEALGPHLLAWFSYRHETSPWDDAMSAKAEPIDTGA